jgi:hypothetical protein
MLADACRSSSRHEPRHQRGRGVGDAEGTVTIAPASFYTADVLGRSRRTTSRLILSSSRPHRQMSPSASPDLRPFFITNCAGLGLSAQ